MPQSTAIAARSALPLFALAWCAAVQPTFAWLVRSSTGSDARLLVLGAVLIGTMLLLLRRAARAERPAASPAPSAPAVPLILLAAGLAAAVCVRRTIAFHSLEAVALGLATYGALGLVLTPMAFRRALPVALLLVSVLPMGGHLETHLGFPLRAETAELVASLLRRLGHDVATRETILLVENHAAQVDLPCSGMKSLWAGLLFFFGASVALRVRAGFAWLAALALFVALLVAANVARVAILSVLALLVQRPVLTETVHAPLGILAFLAAALLALSALRRLASYDAFAAMARVTTFAAAPRHFLILLSAAALAAFAFVPQRDLAADTKALRFNFAPTADLGATAEALTPVEAQFLQDQGADFAGKWRFRTASGLSGSLLVVVARTWRAHHPPEQCLAGAGHAIAGVATELFAADFPVRTVAFANEGARAVYWFEKVETRTADFGARVFDGILAAGRGAAPAWAMVSLLFDAKIDPRDPGVHALARALSSSTASRLKEISP